MRQNDPATSKMALPVGLAGGCRHFDRIALDVEPSHHAPAGARELHPLMAVACDCGEPSVMSAKPWRTGSWPPERARCSARFEEAARTPSAQIGRHGPGQRWPTSLSAMNSVGAGLTPIDQRAPAIERSCARPNAPRAQTSRDVRGRARGVASRHFSPSASPSAAAPACHRGSGGPQRR
jgi:hypothetical protein